MKKAKLFALKASDFVKGFIMAVLTTILPLIYTTLSQGSIPSDKASWMQFAAFGLASGVAYIMKNFLTNSEDKFLIKEG
ncbi:MAG: hypothetical protein ACEQSL_07535 [Sediminibacterium sp.]